MSSLCPACTRSHAKIQKLSSTGPYSDYDICFNAIKKEAENITNGEERKQFIKYYRAFVEQHSRESYDVRMSKPLRAAYPIISKAYVIRNNAVDTDDWRRSDY